MIKKLIFASLIATTFIISCSDDNTEITSTENSTIQEGTSNRVSSTNSVSFPVTLSTVTSSDSISVSSSIAVNPSYTYYSNYNVYAGDGYYSTPTSNCLGDGKSCINLSHFLGMYGAYTSYDFNPATVARFPLFYGENEYYQFQTYPRPQGTSTYSLEQNYYIDEYGSSSPLFNYSSYMTNDAANSVLHQFKDMVATLPNDSQGRTPKIFAAHFKYDSWLSIPAHRQAKMSVRYYYH